MLYSSISDQLNTLGAFDATKRIRDILLGGDSIARTTIVVKIAQDTIVVRIARTIVAKKFEKCLNREYKDNS